MATNYLNVCLLPFHIKWDDAEANINSLKNAVKNIHPKTDLLILPETFHTGFPVTLQREDIISLCECYQSQILDMLLKISSEHNLAICGSLILYKSNVLTNSAFFIEPNGDVVFEPKRHLFTLTKEDTIFQKGNNLLKIRFRGWNIAVSVCYDLRFPVWTRNVSNEYDLMAYVANWPEVRIAAWEKLLPARAIENQAYICGVNCCGTDSKGYIYNGSSHILNYYGEEIGCKTDSDMIYASLSLDKLNIFRSKFPAWKDADNFSII